MVVCCWFGDRRALLVGCGWGGCVVGGVGWLGVGLGLGVGSRGWADSLPNDASGLTAVCKLVVSVQEK